MQPDIGFCFTLINSVTPDKATHRGYLALQAMLQFWLGQAQVRSSSPQSVEHQDFCGMQAGDLHAKRCTYSPSELERNKLLVSLGVATNDLGKHGNSS